MIRFSVILLLTMVTSLAFGQVRISGIIVDSMSFKSLPNVHIKNKRTQSGLVSDENGFFKISAQPFDTLVFSAVGYFPLEFPVLTDEEDILIMMAEEVTYLQSVLVTGTMIQSPLIREKRQAVMRKPNPLPLASGSGIAFDYFTKAQREKRKLLKLIEANDRVMVYTHLITDPDFKEGILKRHNLSEEGYYELILKFNVTRIGSVEWKDEEEVVEILESYFCQQTGMCR